MGQDALFDTTPRGTEDDATNISVPVLKVGQRFRFQGLIGQEGYEMPLPGSGSVGWLIEVNAVSPWGSLSVRCTPDLADPTKGQFTSVGLADAMAMIRLGAWEPLPA